MHDTDARTLGGKVAVTAAARRRRDAPGRRRPTGRLWLVGTGPGDPELLTVAARRLIDEADLVVVDQAVAEGIRMTIPPDTAQVDLGAQDPASRLRWRGVNERVVRLVRNGRSVVRLAHGDPFVSGLGSAELMTLAATGIEIGIVPGIAPGLAGPAAFGIPLTYPGIAQGAVLVTMRSALDDPASTEPLDWHAITTIDTIVVDTTDRIAPIVAGRLLDAGRLPATLVAIIHEAASPTQRIAVTSLGELGAADDRVRDQAPVVLIMGEVVRLHDALCPGS